MRVNKSGIALNKLSYSFALFHLFWYLALITYISPNISFFSGLKGLLSFLSLSILFCFLETILSRGKGIIVFFLLIVFTISTDHLLVNNTHLPLTYWRFFGFTSLVQESLFNTRFMALFFMNGSVYMFAKMIEHCIGLKWGNKEVSAGPALILGFFFFLANSLTPVQLLDSAWAQKNILSYNFSLLFTGGDKTGLSSGTKEFHKQELNAPLWIKEQKTPKKIVLIVLEGVGEKHINNKLMPEMNNIKNKGTFFNRFLSNQMQTNRGLFSLFCGQYPNILEQEAKSDMMIGGGPSVHCLPSALKKRGFTNYFMQSAPLAFMRKDLMAKKMGFHYAAGAASFGREKMIGEWGVGDNTLFSGASVFIDQNQDKKYFLSLLTVGTHHPYITPESKHDFEKAISYTDRQFAQFYRYLEQTNFFNDGLLIVTSDEVRPIEDRHFPISYHRSFLLLIGLETSGLVRSDLYAQIDLPISVLDLFKKQGMNPFSGRSLFRKYSDDRLLFLGNAYSKKSLIIQNKKQLSICSGSYECMDLEYPRSIFYPQDKADIASSDKEGLFRSFVARNDRSFLSEKKQTLFEEKMRQFHNNKEYPLLGEFKTRVNHGKNLQYKIQLKGETFIHHKYLTFNYQYYPCGQPSKLKKFEQRIQSNETLVKIPIDRSKSGEVLCHSAGISANKTNSFYVKSFKLQREL